MSYLVTNYPHIRKVWLGARKAHIAAHVNARIIGTAHAAAAMSVLARLTRETVEIIDTFFDGTDVSVVMVDVANDAVAEDLQGVEVY